MIRLVITAVHPFAQTHKTAAFAHKKLACLLLNKATEFIALIAEFGLRDHVPTELCAEDIVVIQIRSEPYDLGIGERIELRIIRKSNDAHAVFFKNILRGGVLPAGLHYLLGELLRGAVRGGVFAGNEIAAVGNQQQTPPLRVVQCAEDEQTGCYGRPADAVAGAEKVILHVREGGKALLGVLDIVLRIIPLRLL